MQFRAPSPEIRDLFVAAMRTKITEFAAISVEAKDEMMSDARYAAMSKTRFVILLQVSL